MSRLFTGARCICRIRTCAACSALCQKCGRKDCTRGHGRYGSPQRAIWYAVAYDVAGGIAEWMGPLSWSKARTAASEYERVSHVRVARVQRWMASLQDGVRRAA